MYQRILVALDGSDPSTRAFDEALRLAGDQHAKLRIIHVIDVGGLYAAGMEGVDVTPVERAWVDAGKQVLEHSLEQARKAGVDGETSLLETDGERISDVIISAATSWGADLIVMGTHGRHGLGHLLLGSVAEGVVRAARTPVLLVRGT